MSLVGFHASLFYKIQGDLFKKIDWILNAQLSSELKSSETRLEGFLDGWALKLENMLHINWPMLTAMTYSIRTPKIPNFLVAHPVVVHISKSFKTSIWRKRKALKILCCGGTTSCTWILYVVIILTTPSVAQLDFSEEYKFCMRFFLEKK